MSKSRMFEIRGVLILPTDNSNTDILLTSDGTYVHQERPTLVEGETYQFVYIVSSDTVKVGDWITNMANHDDPEYNLYQIEDELDIRTYENNNTMWYKVIATNNPDLGLPNVTMNFISSMVNQFNYKGLGKLLHTKEFIGIKVTTNVLTEFDVLPTPIYVIAGNNMIITTEDNKKSPKIKLYNREEVLKLVTESFGQGFYNGLAHLGNGGEYKSLEEFIVDNEI